MKKSRVALVMLVIGIMIVGCQQKTNQDSLIKTEQKNNSKENSEGMSITIYFENENADGFDTKNVKVEKLTAENLIEQLRKKGVLAEEVQINSFEETEDAGEKALKIDLNKEYLKELQSMGSSGEYMLMGSVCNTFLDAYECNKIQVTVDNQEIVTGYTDYLGYMGKFE